MQHNSNIVCIHFQVYNGVHTDAQLEKEDRGNEENYDKGNRPDRNHVGGSICGIGLFAGSHPYSDRQHTVTYGGMSCACWPVCF